MYELIVKTQFAAAHNLRHYKGKCEHLHGHNWNVDIIIRKNDLDKLGMVMDFNALKKITAKILGGLDHKYLNNLKEFRRLNPTTENIARLIYESLEKKLINKGVRVARVFVWESPYCGAGYYKTTDYRL